MPREIVDEVTVRLRREGLPTHCVLRDPLTGGVVPCVHDFLQPGKESKVHEFQLDLSSKLEEGRNGAVEADEMDALLLELEVQDDTRVTFCDVGMPLAEIALRKPV